MPTNPSRVMLKAAVVFSVAVIVQVYLSIHRPDLAKKELERAKRWAEDDLLLQHIEASINE